MTFNWFSIKNFISLFALALCLSSRASANEVINVAKSTKPGSFFCKSYMCIYHLLNKDRFSAEGLMSAVQSSLSNEKEDGFDSSQFEWIREHNGTPIDGSFLAFGAKTESQRKKIKEHILDWDLYHNNIDYERVRVTLLIYHLQNLEDEDVGIGFDGAFRSNSLKRAGIGGWDQFTAQVNTITGLFGGLTQLLRIQLNLSYGESYATLVDRMEDDVIVGANFVMGNETPVLILTDAITPEKTKFGYNLRGSVNRDGNRPDQYSIGGLYGEYAFYNRNESSEQDVQEFGKEVLGVRVNLPNAIPINPQYPFVENGVPRVIKDVRTNIMKKGKSRGFYYGADGANYISRIVVFLVVERVKKDRELTEHDQIMIDDLRKSVKEQRAIWEQTLMQGTGLEDDTSKSQKASDKENNESESEPFGFYPPGYEG